MQRRIEQADGHRHSGQLAKDAFEIALLKRENLVECLAPALLIPGQNHFPHAQNPLLGEEHVLGAAEADSVRTEEARHARVLRRIRVGADAQRADLISPFQQPVEVPKRLRLLRLHRAFNQHLDDFRGARGELSVDDFTGRAIDGDPVALLQRFVSFHSQFSAAVVDAQ